ncbi:hypothetical protein BDV28DRAFT_35236 [Aspergillus coremiiformis]|uniref:Uncharacterized protein n=1 Tax=Aspergillus coremiiformis TaxID=138285 RepID=A0A5N6Z1P4_9EURO|nr:hypothetical protein BDV28DRAFT_35236 [Aspergillus coremiiformis]
MLKEQTSETIHNIVREPPVTATKMRFSVLLMVALATSTMGHPMTRASYASGSKRSALSVRGKAPALEIDDSSDFVVAQIGRQPP